MEITRIPSAVRPFSGSLVKMIHSSSPILDTEGDSPACVNASEQCDFFMWILAIVVV
jgi:hypothetical protein